jgi:hypothetical protein
MLSGVLGKEGMNMVLNRVRMKVWKKSNFVFSQKFIHRHSARKVQQ